MTIARSVASVTKGVASAVTRGQGAGGGGPFDYIGSNALAAYDIAALKTDATRAFRVRRSSDNTERDCLTVAEAVTFCGGGSGFITTWYDQNASVNLSQATTTLQMRIVSTGTGDAGLVGDGSNDCYRAAAFLGGTTAMTVCAWIKTASSANQTIACSWDGNGRRSWLLRLNASKLEGFASADGGDTNMKQYIGGTTISSAWVHTAMVYGSGTIKLYINAAEETVTKTVDGTVASLYASPERFSIGRQAIDSGTFEPLNGSIRDLRIWSVAKSAAEILAIKNMVTPS